MLKIEKMSSFYELFQALFDVSLEVNEGESVALIGANGAGKSTLLKSIVGAVRVDKNCVSFQGQSVGGQSEMELLRRGVALVPEGRRLFPSLSVRENIELAMRNGRKGRWDINSVFQELPALEELKNRPSTALSGGQQQLVAIARSLVTNPQLLLCDEVSLGLSPFAVKEIYRLLGMARKDGMSVVIVEQNLKQALNSSDRFYCLQKGCVALTGNSAEADEHAVENAYFGV